MRNCYSLLGLLMTGWMLFSFSSCENFFISDSNRLMYDKSYGNMARTDSVYSLLGILTKMQKVADRYVLLGELRGDLVVPNDHTSGDLRDLALFSATPDNCYNRIRDYYDIVNGCNCYLAYLDTTGQRYMKEYAAAKAIRAWTYLQIELNYGRASYFTQPVLTVEDNNRDYPVLTIDEICPLLIADLEPLVVFDRPDLGEILTLSSEYFFVPVRVILADLYLWNGDYSKAAETYYDYIFLNQAVLNPSYRIYHNDASYSSVRDGWSVSWSSVLPDETICFVPMATDPSDGRCSDLDSIFSGGMNGRYQVEASDSYIQTNLQQSYYLDAAGEYTNGDLRLRSSVAGVWNRNTMMDTMNIRKNSPLQSSASANTVMLYRLPHIYLRFAEACNQAGYSSLAFTVLKYGLTQDNIIKYVAPSERQTGARFLNFDHDAFLSNGAVHARGSGDTDYSQRYSLTVGDSVWVYDSDNDVYNYVAASPEYKAAVKDSLDNLILEEMALETAFEGNRFQDLIRFARRRNDNSFLATKVASRGSEFNENLYRLLLDEKNWYLSQQ